MDSTTHIAGGYITIGGRTIQRCAWCGEKLIDTRGQVVVGPDCPSASDKPLHWPGGRLVRVTAGEGLCVSRAVLLDESEQLPPDSCEELAE